MKRILFALILIVLAASSSFAASDLLWSETFTSTSHSAVTVTVASKGLAVYRASWVGTGTRTTCSGAISYSVDGTTWSEGIVIADCTTDGTSALTNINANYVKLDLDLSGAGNNVRLTLAGWVYTPASTIDVDSLTIDLTNTNAHLSNIDAGKLEEATFTSRVGEVQAEPTANTILGRLKSLEDGQTAIEGKIDDLLDTYTDGKAHVITDSTSVVGPSVGAVFPVSNATAGDLVGQFHAFDGAGNALTSTARGSERALSVQVVDGSGTQITSFGGSASSFGSAFPATGTASGFYDGTNMVAGRVESVGGKNALVVTTVDDSGNPVSSYLSSANDSVTIALPGGATPYSYISLATANQVNVKASAGTLFSLTALNMTANVQYLLLFDKATAPDQSACSANSDCPVMYFPIPTMADTNGAGFTINLGPLGIAFANGIGFSIIGGSCGEVATCVNETNAAAGVVLTLGYK
jgi:hypothetical protein